MKNSMETYCFCCENLLLKEDGHLVCLSCSQKARRRDPLMRAALRRTLVAVVPVLCPHEKSHGRCKFSGKEARHFNIIVLDKNLEPRQITGPYSIRAAERIAKQVRRKIDRDGK